MRKNLLIIALILISTVSYAQSGRSIYNKYSEVPNVSAVYISPEVFNIVGTMPDMPVNDMKINLASIIKSLNGFYMLESNSKSFSSSIVSDVEKMVKNNKYELLMEVKENGEKIRVFITMNGEFISSLVMLVVSEEEAVFINLEGMMDRQSLKKLLAESIKASKQ